MTPPAQWICWVKHPTPWISAAQLDESLSGVSGTLMDLYYSAKDAAAELIDRLDAYDTNDAELDEIEQRAGSVVPSQTQVR